MTQKLILLFFTIGLIAFTSACSDDDDNSTNKNRLPDTAVAFIDSRLPEYDILKIEEVDDNGDEWNEKYVVSFSGNLTVTFTSLGYWRRIEGQSNLPELILDVLPPFGGAAAIKKAYPSQSINKIQVKYYGYQVALGDGTCLAFYDTSYSSKFGLDLTGSLAEWPEAARNFITKYYRGSTQDYYFISESIEDGSGYHFAFSDGRAVYFDKDGKQYYVNNGKFAVPDELYKSLPETSRDIIENKYEGGIGLNYITALAWNDTYYQALMTNSFENKSVAMLFDMQTGEELEAPEQAAMDFINSLGDSTEELTLTSTAVFNPKMGAFHFVGIIRDNVTALNMHTDKDGNMLSFSLAGGSIPSKILDYMPAGVKKYIGDNQITGNIILVYNGWQNSYIVAMRNNVMYFDKDGNFIYSSN